MLSCVLDGAVSVKTKHKISFELSLTPGDWGHILVAFRSSLPLPRGGLFSIFQDDSSGISVTTNQFQSKSASRELSESAKYCFFISHVGKPTPLC